MIDSKSCKQVVRAQRLLHTDRMDDAAASAIDEDIVSGRVVAALIGIRAELGCGIPAAIDEFSERYERLRAERPDDFTLSRDEYGRGVYS